MTLIYHQNAYFHICAFYQPDPDRPVPGHVVFHDLPVTTEAHTMVTVTVNAIASELHSAFSVYSNSSPAVATYTVADKSCQLCALNDSYACCPVAGHHVAHHI